MAAYYVIFSGLALSAFFEKKSHNNKAYFNLLIIFIILFVGLRYQVGNDYAEYHNVFFLIKQGYVNYFEPLFTALVLASPNPYIMFFIAALLSLVLIKKAIEYFKPDEKLLSFVMYYGIYLVLYNIHIVRQGIALGLIMFSWKYAFEKKPLKYILFVVLAMGFHRSAIVALPIYFLANAKIGTLTKMISLSVSTILLILFNAFKEQIFAIISLIPMLERYASVYSNQLYSSFVPLSFGFFLNSTLLLFTEFILKKRKISFGTKDNFIYNIFFVSVIASLVLRFSAVMLRLNYYYQISNIFMFCIVISSFREKKIVKLLVLIIALLYLYINLNTGNAILDYQTIINQ